jgi:hypothetical protein
MNIDKQLKSKLEKVDFVIRYMNICNKYSNYDKSMDSVNIEEVKEIFESLLLPFKFYKSERFFKLNEKVDSYYLQFNIVVKSGYVQFIWHIKQNEEPLKLGWGMWESIIEEMTSLEYTRKPLFCSYLDLEAILKEVFSIYEDFKEELLKKETN